MKLFFVVLVSALAVSAAQEQPAKKAATGTRKTATKSASKTAAASNSATASKSAAKVTDASKPMAIPAEAKQDSSGDYLYTDAQGKKWIYRKTPFGVTRIEGSTERAAAQAAPAAGAGIKAFDDGDKVRFERKGPFGVWKWEKQKSELDESERAALQAAQANRQNASKED